MTKPDRVDQVQGVLIALAFACIAVPIAAYLLWIFVSVIFLGASSACPMNLC